MFAIIRKILIYSALFVSVFLYADSGFNIANNLTRIGTKYIEYKWWTGAIRKAYCNVYFKHYR